ncbi:MAG: YqaA family protein [Desulfomonilaceae bacterium]|nr:YqaA family protein [Desulfomonilaceae bacterium]
MIGYSPGRTVPYAVPALFLLAFSESSFFPVPPDVLLIALAISIPSKAFYFAAVCSVGSVLGGMLGYLIGYEFMEVVGNRIVAFYGFMDKWQAVGELYNNYAAWAVAIAGFTPIPYKVFTIAGGAFKIDFLVFVLASFVSRSARFFLVSTLIYYFGPPIKSFIDKYFNTLAIVFAVLLVGGFVLVKYVMN